MNRWYKALVILNAIGTVALAAAWWWPTPPMKLEAKLTYTKDPRTKICYSLAVSPVGQSWILSHTAVPCESVPPALLSPWFGK